MLKYPVPIKPIGGAVIGAVVSVVIVGVSLVSAIAIPFSTYALTLACFGITHVLVELRYVDSRFSGRLGATLVDRLLVLVLAIALIRLGSVGGLLPPHWGVALELLCGLGLVAIATLVLGQQHWRWGTWGLGVGSLLALGIYVDPIVTSVGLAIIHNLTPIGFILERQPSRRILLLCLLIFVVLPLFILVWQWLNPVSFSWADNTTYLAAFVPPLWQNIAIAYPLFSAVTFLQCMHYAAVIGLFSQWTEEHPKVASEIEQRIVSKTVFPWGSTRAVYGYLIVIAIVFWIAFQQSFGLTRALYGTIAAVHAWIEIPLLLLLAPIWQPTNQQPHAVGSEIRPKR
ncbi:MAG TPA: hypothetical protein V6C88_15835 [Chroococcidiopsis sp.]